MKLFKNNSTNLPQQEKRDLRVSLKLILGYTPHFLPLYITALTHQSMSEDLSENNERLEYLGDAFISAIVGNYLFKKYPTEDEGFLTEMRSKIVSRKSLDDLAKRIGLDKIVRYNRGDNHLRRSHIFGNALEALVGAVYLDVGYKKTERFFMRQVLEPNVNMDELEHTDLNFKNKLYTWSQHHDKSLEFETISDIKERGRRIFTIAVAIAGKEVARATGFSKKEASQEAARKAIEALGSPD